MRQSIKLGGGGGRQADPDMKIDFSEVGIGEIGISDFLTSNFVFWQTLTKSGSKKFWNFPLFTQNPLQLSEYSFLS